MQTSIIVVNYNGERDLPACLEALASDGFSRSCELLIVDNASTDDSLGVIERLIGERSGTRVIRSEENRGYAGGVNFALPDVAGSFLAIMNSDVIVERGALELLANYLESHTEIGAVNPLLVLDEAPEVINSAGLDVHPTGLGFNRWLGQPRQRAGSDTLETTGVHGAVFMLRKSILDELGGWDESGFLYHEDVNLSWLLQLSGWGIHCLPEAVVRHRYHLSMYPQKLFLLERNRVVMLLTNLRVTTLLWLSPMLLVTEVLILGFCALRGLAFLRAKLSSYRWVLERRIEIKRRRPIVEEFRRRSDWSILRRLEWRFPLDQFRVLVRRGGNRREPIGGLPTGPSERGESR